MERHGHKVEAWSGALAGLLVGAGLAALAVSSMKGGFAVAASISPVALLSISAGLVIRWFAIRK